MLQIGSALKVTLYLTDGDTHHGASSAAAVIDFLFKEKVSGATAVKGFAGFGSDHHLHSSASVFVADHLPVKIEFVETKEKVAALFPTLKELVGTGMITAQDTTVLKAAG